MVPKVFNDAHRQTDMFLFGVLYKDSTLTTISKKVKIKNSKLLFDQFNLMIN